MHFFSLAGDAKRNQGIRLRLRWLIPDGVKKRRVKTRRFGGMDHGKDGFAFLLYRFESQDSWRNLLFYNKRKNQRLSPLVKSNADAFGEMKSTRRRGGFHREAFSPKRPLGFIPPARVDFVEKGLAFASPFSCLSFTLKMPVIHYFS